MKDLGHFSVYKAELISTSRHRKKLGSDYSAALNNLKTIQNIFRYWIQVAKDQGP